VDARWLVVVAPTLTADRIQETRKTPLVDLSLK